MSKNISFPRFANFSYTFKSSNVDKFSIFSAFNRVSKFKFNEANNSKKNENNKSIRTVYFDTYYLNILHFHNHINVNYISTACKTIPDVEKNLSNVIIHKSIRNDKTVFNNIFKLKKNEKFYKIIHCVMQFPFANILTKTLLLLKYRCTKKN